MGRYLVEHHTIYRYSRPVAFGPHRLVLHPRGGPELRVLEARIDTSPPSILQWSEDALGNAIAHASFRQRASELRIENRIEIERLGSNEPIESPEFPVAYDPIERADLAGAFERHHSDPDRAIESWARRFTPPGISALDAIRGMAAGIRGAMRYEPRDMEGTQPPRLTLERRVGACRDFASLFIEGCRSLGIAARFVSGYLYDPARDVGDPSPAGGATHAWAQVYLPGPGWLDVDPTHARIGSEGLIGVAVSHDARRLVPVSGTWFGFPGDAIGMEVWVHVRRLDRTSERSNAA